MIFNIISYRNLNKPIYYGRKNSQFIDTKNTIDLSDIPNYQTLILYETLWPIASRVSYYQTEGSFWTNVSYTYDSLNGKLYFTGTCMNGVSHTIDIYYIP